jgi:putative acetyltransferase
MHLNDVHIRSIQPNDNIAIAKIIRRTLEEFNANHPGTVYFDPTTDHLFELFQQMPGSVYYVAEQQASILGGGGIYPSEGLPAGTCELVKLYLVPEARGIGLGSALIRHCIGKARNLGYQKVYLETMNELNQAIKTYEKFGFTFLKGPLGNTGHFGCDLHMILDLNKVG